MKNEQIIGALPELPDEDLERINAYARRVLSREEIYAFPVTLCDNEVDRDNERFSIEALEQLSKLFVGKTGIFDHTAKSSNQKARIYAAEVCSDGRMTRAGERYHWLRAKAYMIRNEENRCLIDEIDAGIKKEVSVSCRMERAVCSVCGCDGRKQACAHTPGKTYGQTYCHKVLSMASDAYEFSFVAVPAQPGAGVSKAFAHGQEGESSVEEAVKALRETHGEVRLSAGQARQLREYIDTVEEFAQTGKRYHEELKNRVSAMCAAALPEVDTAAVRRAADVMSTQELINFKTAFEKRAGGTACTPQLYPGEKKEQAYDYNDFRI